MRWKLFAVFGLSASCVASLAQGQPGDQLPDDQRSATHVDGLLTKSGMAHFELIQGRIHLDPVRHRKGSQQQTSSGQFEHISVNVERGIPSLHYVLKTSGHHLTVNVHQARSLRAESWLVERNEQAVLRYDEYGDVELGIRHVDIHDHHVGATLLHVRQADAAGFDRHFGELFQRMLQGVSLREVGDATNQKLVRTLGDSNLPNLVNVRGEIDRLASSRRAERIQAERVILSWGTPAIALIRSIPTRNLDAQQRAKLDSIIARMRSHVADTPASLAKMLTSDATYWTVISGQLNRQQLNLATAHLKHLGIDIHFDRQPVERIATSPDVKR